MDLDGLKKRGFVAIDAKSPFDTGLWEVLVSPARMEVIKRRGMIATCELVHCVREVLLSPKAIFEGIRTDPDEDERNGPGWLCYSGIPEHAFSSQGSPMPPYENEVFLVFINHERVAYNWRWEKCDLDNSNVPVNADTRFLRKLAVPR